MAKVLKTRRGGAVAGRVRRGDEVTAFNGREFVDILDYIYADSLDRGVISLVRNGAKIEVEYAKDPGASLGLEFGAETELEPRECRNNCPFCFVRQLPEGLRESLYVRDDDYRLSFVCGTYATGTNFAESDIRRILDYRLSPLYFSVHSTDESVRRAMLGVKSAPPILGLLKRLIDGGIDAHCQIVLVEGMNDGAALEKSLRDLLAVGAASVAVVPVGLTKHRSGLPDISPVSAECAREAIRIVERIYSERPYFCYCSDEMYERAGLGVKAREYYGEFVQIENGVGLEARFLSEVEEALKGRMRAHAYKKRRAGVFTGMSGARAVEKAASMIEAAHPDTRIRAYPVPNRLFGETATVTGLVSAGDILAEYGSRVPDEDFFIVPSVMLREFGDVFLDDVSFGAFRRALKKRVIVSRCDGASFVEAAMTGRSRA